MKKQKFIKLGIILLIAIVVSTSTYAFAAANTVPTSKAGAGSGAISGYTVSNVHYNLNATNPSTIDSITFTLDSAPKAGSTIKIKLVSAGSTWYVCTNISTAVTCSSLSVSVVSVNTLEVVIAD
ncbi:MAG: hypothetical protein ABIJ65_01440 [Chloroflexota bacterium]